MVVPLMALDANGVPWRRGDRFVKDTGDYTFHGEVVGVIGKRSGVARIVGEDDRGLLFIFNPKVIKRIEL